MLRATLLVQEADTITLSFGEFRFHKAQAQRDRLCKSHRSA